MRPFLADPIVVEADPGDAPEPVADPGADLIAWAQNETSTGVMVAVERPAWRGRGAGGDRRHLGGRRARGRHATDGRLLLCAAEGVRRRRRPLGEPAEPGREGPDRASSTASRGAGSRPSSRCGSRSRTRAGTRPTTRRPWRRCSCSSTRSSGCSARAGWPGAWQRSRASAAHLYGWAEQREFASPFVADPGKRSPVVGTIDFSDEIDAAALAGTLRSNGIVDVEPYRKLGRNQLRVGMFPAVEPADVEALTACVDWCVENAAEVRR